MAASPSSSLTVRETHIMQALWSLGSATAEEIRQALRDPLHDSTVRTLLRILESKGYVRHFEQGRAFVYRPAVGRASVELKAVRSLLKRFFGGSAEALVLRLIEDEQITPEQLEELKKAPRARQRRRGRGGAS
jgi:predicted transcriptional regulator